MIPYRQIRRALSFASPIVRTRFSAPRAAALLNRMEENYPILAPQVPVLKSSFNRMTLKIAVDVLAFYRALLTELSDSESKNLIQPFVNNWMDGQFDTWIARKVFAHRTLHQIYRRWWFARANRADEAYGQRFEYVPPDGDLFYGVNVTRCGLGKYLARMGVPELTPYICRGDHHVQQYLPQGIEFRRTGVIAEGGQYCDFRYYIV